MPTRPAHAPRREAARKGGGALGKFAEPIPADRAGGTLPKIEQQLVRTKLRPFAAGVVDREPHEIGVVDEGLAAGRQILYGTPARLVRVNIKRSGAASQGRIFGVPLKLMMFLAP